MPGASASSAPDLPAVFRSDHEIWPEETYGRLSSEADTGISDRAKRRHRDVILCQQHDLESICHIVRAAAGQNIL